jgi:hypothetical protein
MEKYSYLVLAGTSIDEVDIEIQVFVINNEAKIQHPNVSDQEESFVIYLPTNRYRVIPI